MPSTNTRRATDRTKPWRTRRFDRLRRALVVAGLVVLVTACAPNEEPPLVELPDPPDGSQLVLEIGELEVWKTFEGDVCAGTLRRIELHTRALAELFDMDPPRARVFLYAELGPLNEGCPTTQYVGGCALQSFAHATADSVTHELVHVFVLSTTKTRTSPAIEEGVAERFAGRVSPSRVDPLHLEEWEAFDLARWEAFDLNRWEAQHFFAWVIDRFGLDAVLDAHVATSRVAEEEVGAVVAQTLGFESVAELHAEYEATSALYYPMMPATTKVFTAEELATGGTLDLSCEGPYAEGPGAKWFGQIEPDMAVTVARIEILEAGEYQVFIGPLGDNSSTWEPTELYDEPLAWKEERQGRRCSGSPPPFPMYFPTPGQYEIHVGVPIDEARQTEVAVRDTGSNDCPPP